jgi:hypothetical protein
MTRIGRIAIGTTTIRKTALFLKPFFAVVTRLAQRLQLSEPKFLQVTMMRFDVISDNSSSNFSMLQTLLAPWQLLELEASVFDPTRGSVKMIPT